MIRIAQKSIRHPWIAITAWLAIVAGLGFLGSRIESQFDPTILAPKGTESARAEKLAANQFGHSVLTPIMLVGPARQLDRQGPALVAKLRARSDTRVLSPWDGTPGSDVLRPKKTAATIVASVEHPEKYVIAHSLPQIERTVDQSISGGVTAHITGQASIDRAMRDMNMDHTRIALAIALPALLLILLLVTRAPVAALVITGFATSLLPVGYGLTAIATNLIPIDVAGVPGAAMVGLALGAGFGLLMVTRFREALEREKGDPQASAHAAAESSTSAGRAVLIAGTAMVGAMILSSALSMPEILNSVGTAATVMAFAAAAAVVGVLPAVLRVTGTRIGTGAFSFGRAAGTGHARGIGWLPAAVGGAVLVLLVGLSAPVLSMSSGPPDARLLPKDSQARKDFEAVARVMGPGWVSPFEIVVTRSGKPITTRWFLGELSWFERQTGRDSAVDSVLGPGALLANANELQGVPNGLDTAAATAEKSKKSLKKLIAGLRLATDGVGQLRGGLGEAATGAGQLHGGTGQAYGGSGRLESGLDQANAGAVQLKTGAKQAAAGATQLAGGLANAKAGVMGGYPSIANLVKAVESNATAAGKLGGGASATKDEVSAAAAELAAMTVGRGDPRYARVVAGLERAAANSDALAAQIANLARDAGYTATAAVVVRDQVKDLRDGIAKLEQGGSELAAGLHKLSGGNTQLASGIAQLDAGGAKLQDGLRQLNDGAGQLAAGLASGAGPSAELFAGMQTITRAVVKSRDEIPSTAALVKLKKEAPGLFDSGYFVLAAIDGAPRPARDAAAFVVNAAQGGFAGRITVVPKEPATSASTRALHKRLSAATERFAGAFHAQAAVGGTAGDLVDYRELGLERLPVVIAGLALLTFIALAIVTRSLITPGVAVALNLITTAAVFGVLSLLFSGDSPPLGGPGFVDPVTMISVVTIVLALSIVYEVFALERLRSISGAGLVMVVALLPFVPSDLTLIRQLAIGTALAVVVDSLVVRRLLMGAETRRPRLAHLHLPHRPLLHH